jgi:hypothetical protein
MSYVNENYLFSEETSQIIACALEFLSIELPPLTGLLDGIGLYVLPIFRPAGTQKFIKFPRLLFYCNPIIYQEKPRQGRYIGSELNLSSNPKAPSGAAQRSI